MGDQVGELATILSPYYSDDKGHLALEPYKTSDPPPSRTSLGEGKPELAEALLADSPGVAEVQENWNREGTQIQWAMANIFNKTSICKGFCVRKLLCLF